MGVSLMTVIARGPLSRCVHSLHLHCAASTGLAHSESYIAVLASSPGFHALGDEAIAVYRIEKSGMYTSSGMQLLLFINLPVHQSKVQ